MPLCCPSFTCGSATSSRGAGRFSGSGGFGRRGASFVSPSSCPGLRNVVRRCSQGHTERTAACDAGASAAVAPSGGGHFLCRRPRRRQLPSTASATCNWPTLQGRKSALNKMGRAYVQLIGW